MLTVKRRPWFLPGPFCGMDMQVSGKFENILLVDSKI